MRKISLIILWVIIGVMKSHSQDNVIAVLPDKLNVIYTGFDNPITVAAANVPADKLVVTLDKGTIRGGNGNYFANIGPDAEGYATISVSYMVGPGKNQSIGKTKFRIMSVPDPTPAFGEKEKGDISMEEAKNVTSINVRLYDFVFEGIKFHVKRFRFMIISRSGNDYVEDGKSFGLTQTMKDAIIKAQRGDQIMISRIWASFPGSIDRKLPTNVELTIR